MNSSSKLALYQVVNQTTFDKLRSLWEVFAESHITAGQLFRENSWGRPAKSPDCDFSLLVSPTFTGLLRGRPLEGSPLFEVRICFEPEDIETFLKKFALEQQIQSPDLSALIRVIHLQQYRFPSHAREEAFHFFLELIKLLPGQFFQGVDFPAEALQVQDLVHRRLEQEEILNHMTYQINHNLDLLPIIQITLEQVQKLLNLDRLLIYQINQPQGKNQVTYEAKSQGKLPSALNFDQDQCVHPDRPSPGLEAYGLGQGKVVENINTVHPPLEPCFLANLEKFRVQAFMNVPILVKGKLWGLLIAHQCDRPRRWKSHEQKFLKHLADYLAIAIYQSDFYQQLHQQKQQLENLVNQRAKELQEALSSATIADRYKEEFIGTISHELLTPLTCIIGLSSTLLNMGQNSGSGQGLSPEKQKQYLETINTNGKNLMNIIKDMLDFSQLEAQKSLLSLEEFLLSKLCRRVIANLWDQAQQKNITLQLKLFIAKDEAKITGDAYRIEQILEHLLNNAIKFTPVGGDVILRVWREQREIIFQVEDNGIGITDQQKQTLFDSFRQSEPTLTRVYSGTGLGLALTKRLIEMQRGSIEVDSQPNKGSTFTVHLPDHTQSLERLQRQAMLKKVKKFLPQPSLLARKQKQVVFLVEADGDNGSFLCDLLTAADYQVLSFLDERELFDVMPLFLPVLVVLNPTSLEKSLGEFVARLRKDYAHHGIKIAVIHYDPEQARADLQAQGLSESVLSLCCPSPLSASDFVAGVNHLLKPQAIG